MNTNTESPKFPACKCGCGLGVRFSDATYLPGHDAKHKGQIARQVILLGTEEPIAQLPSLALQAQARELVAKWTAKGKAPATKGVAAIKIDKDTGEATVASAELDLEERVEEAPTAKYEIKIGRWTYPVKMHGHAYLMNDKRDGSGEWGTLEAETAKRVYKIEEN